MATTEDTTSLICLFHHRDNASAATEDLYRQGVSHGAIHVIGLEGFSEETGTMLDELGLPARDRQHVLTGLQDGGVVVAVKAEPAQVATVEKIFGQHQAEKIDEAEAESAAAAVPVAASTDEEAVIPIVAEDLTIGKRTVDQGGVRLYRRVVEVPVEQSVQLREEHVVVDRHVVDRPATEADFALQSNKTIELNETAEEVVVGKTAHVVEEVVIGKSVTERTEHVHDTVRHTEVELEEMPAGTTQGLPRA